MSETVGGAPYIGTGTRRGGVELPGGFGRFAVYGGEGDDANILMLWSFVKSMKRYRRRVARSFADEFGLDAREVVPECILSMICELHFPSPREDELTDEQVCR